MSYFPDGGNVRLYRMFCGGWECPACTLNDSRPEYARRPRHFYTISRAQAHIHEHRDHGDKIPDSALQQISAEISEHGHEWDGLT